MRAARISRHGSPDVILNTEIARPEPTADQLRIRVNAAGVGPWDALIREGHSALPQTLPLTLGSDIAGMVDAVGRNVSEFRVGDEVYGLTSRDFTGGYAEYAVASAGTMARKPDRLSFIEAASSPVVAVTAFQMLFEYAHAIAGQTVLIHGGAGNVGAYAVQLARNAGLHVAATAAGKDLEFVRSLGAGAVVDYRKDRFENVLPMVDIVLDTVGGDALDRSLKVLKPNGIFVSVVSSSMPKRTRPTDGPRTVFFIVEVTTARLNALAELFDSGKVVPHVGTVLALEDACIAHQMLAGAPHAPGKIVLNVAA